MYSPAGALDWPWPRVSNRRMRKSANSAICGSHIVWSQASEWLNTSHGRATSVLPSTR